MATRSTSDATAEVWSAPTTLGGVAVVLQWQISRKIHYGSDAS